MLKKTPKILKKTAVFVSRWYTKGFGLKPTRVKEWLTVLTEGDRKPGLKGWLEMARLLAVGLLNPRKQRWHARLRVCQTCPVYDRDLKRCQPYTGSPLGCGCYMPFKAIAGTCWLKDRGLDTNWP